MTVLITVIAQYLVVIVGLIAVAAAVLSERAVRNSIIKLAVLSFAIAFLISFVAGTVYYDARPFVVENIEPLVPHQPDNGFPSHHTLGAMVAAATIFVYRRRLGVLLSMLGVLAGIARIVAGLHYPVDIAGSILIAVIAVFCAWMALKKLDRRFRHSSRPG
ncbi:MAG: phosphatase PAP2 family protein [Chloroflexota bacterium]